VKIYKEVGRIMIRSMTGFGRGRAQADAGVSG